MTRDIRFIHKPEAVFRGSRDYVHSTDLYDEIAAGAAAGGLEFRGPIDLRISKRITRAPLYSYIQESATIKGFPAICSFQCGHETWHCQITESKARIEKRRSYKSHDAHNLAEISGKRIALREECGLRPIETITSLAVALHNNAFPPDVSNKWLLVRLALEKPLESDCTSYVTLALDRLIGQTMTTTTITGRSGRVGMMMFLLSGA